MIIGGFSISDNALRYVGSRRGRLFKAAARLAPEVLNNGIIQDRAQLAAALRQLHVQVSDTGESVPVILTGFSSNVFVQFFSIPGLSDAANIDKAIKMNLEMLAPWDLKDSYYDAQRIKGGAFSGQLDFLCAFAKASLVDDWTSVLRENNFNVLAVEFPSLSLSRLARQRGTGIDFNDSHLLLDASEEGFNLMILVKGQLYFSRFLAWQTIRNEGDDLREALLRQIKEILDFYTRRFSGQLKNVIMTPNIVPELAALIQEHTALKIKKLNLDSLPDFKADWFSALGAYLRGLLPRSEDTMVSLSAKGAESKYWRSFAVHFLKRWRKLIFGGLSAALIAFLITDSIFLKTEQRLSAQLAQILSRPDIEEVKIYQEKAANFNNLVELAGFLESVSQDWSVLLARLKTLAGRNIIFDKISIEADRGTILGRGESEVAVIEFKNRLLAEQNLENVDLPLSSIAVGLDKKAVFTLNFQIKSF